MAVLETLDNAITGVFGSWNVYSTGLTTALVALFTYRIATLREPDVHPMLLARQSVPSTVRHEGESAIYRAQASPHSMPLNGGLNVKDPGAAKWSRGRDGDLRDIWRKAALGGESGAKGKLFTVLGSEKVTEHKAEDITRQINLIGQHISNQGGIRVAIYLPNSTEFLAALFACSFSKNLTPVLIPFDVPAEDLTSMLRRAAVDTLVTAPGALAFDAVVKAYPALRQLIWVVDEGSSHMDWNEVPEGTGSSVNVSTWQDIVNEAPADAGAELGTSSADTTPQDIVTFWQNKSGQMEDMVRFSQANLVAGIAGQIAAVPAKDRLGPSDLFLPADPLTNIHTLTLTLVALFSNASVAFNSVAGRNCDLTLATRGVAPTIIVASPQSVLRTHAESTGKLGAGLAKVSHALSTRTLVQEGVLSTSHFLSSFATGTKPNIGNTPGKLRLLYVADRAGAGDAQIPSSVLADLRIFLGARIIYALSASRVAGSVAQTAFFDYRVSENVETHFGAPVTSVELFFKDSGDYKTTDEEAIGEIYVRGPSVSGGEAALGMVGRLNEDHTISYV